MIENLILTLSAIWGNEVFAPLMLIIIIAALFLGLVIGITRKKDEGLLKGLFGNLVLFSTVITIGWGGFVFLIGLIDLPNEYYAEIKKEICISKNYNTKDTMRKYFNEKDQKINILQRTRINSDYLRCKQENEWPTEAELKAIKKEFLSYSNKEEGKK